MATVYKVELELVSDWVNYTPESLKSIIKAAIENYDTSNPKMFKEIRIDKDEINVERK